MKRMTCRQLGGACDREFMADSFREMAKLSAEHGMEMFGKGDAEHIEAMNRMKGLMSDGEAMKKWMQDREREFDGLPECE